MGFADAFWQHPMRITSYFFGITTRFFNYLIENKGLFSLWIRLVKNTANAMEIICVMRHK